MTETLQMIGLYFVAALLHEWAHIAMGEILGLPAKGFRLTWAGSIGVIRRSGGPLANLLVSASGPLMSVLVAILIWPYALNFALINLCLGICNLMPIHGADGDHIWRSLAQLGFIKDPTLPRSGLAESHRWLKDRGYSDWDLEQMELAEEWPAGWPASRLPKMEYRN